MDLSSITDSAHNDLYLSSVLHLFTAIELALADSSNHPNY